MASVPAHLVATPVLERIPGEVSGVVLGAGATAAWVDLDGFVVAVTTREVPLLPNAVALAAGAGALAGAGAGSGGTARLLPGRVTLGSLQVTWDPAAPPRWDPTVPFSTGVTREAVGARGAALLRALGAGVRARPEELVRELGRIGVAIATDPEGSAGLSMLLRAVGARDPEPAAAAVGAQGGGGARRPPPGAPPRAPRARPPARRPPARRPPLAVLGPVLIPPGRPLDALLAALRPPPGRTTALSATLLALALNRRLPEPAGRLLDLGPGGERAWPAALARLERLGHGSGRAYAAGIAATASLLAAGAPARG